MAHIVVQPTENASELASFKVYFLGYYLVNLYWKFDFGQCMGINLFFLTSLALSVSAFVCLAVHGCLIPHEYEINSFIGNRTMLSCSEHHVETDYAYSFTYLL